MIIALVLTVMLMRTNHLKHYEGFVGVWDGSYR